ncbi:MAG: aspartate aminotransferase family protein [Clostridia bacterium]|nr:aspartate aminotransferase family protein [Clostridia bacterium]
MSFLEIQKKDEKYIAGTYGRFSVAIDKGENATIYDVEGKKYIDFTSGIGVNSFGMNDEEWKSAVVEQINKTQHVCNLYYVQPQVELAAALCKLSGAKKVFFGNSGAEANECAIKAARKYSALKYGDEVRYEIVTMKESFHGRTLATLTATGQDAFHHYFGPFPTGFVYAKPTYEDIIEKISDKTCAVMLELIQGESGVNVIDEQTVKAVEKLCQEKDILLIVDEVQTGNGRTGEAYAFHGYGISPDIVTTAKGLGGGLPIGACMFFEKTEKALTKGDHGTTFGGNPVACAAALSVVNRLTDDLLQQVKEKGEYLKTELEKMDGVKSVSGRGMMLGVLVDDERTSRQLAEKALEKGLLILTAHEKLRLLPPLTITKDEMDEGLKILKEVLQK